MANTETLIIECKHCGKKNPFEQPYPYHAGFADQGFLYNDAGNLTLVWSTLDPVLDELFPGQPTWALNLLNRRRFEKLLLPAPSGGRWRFRNPARCTHCGKPVMAPMLRSVHYLLCPGSIRTDRGREFKLRDYLRIPT
jgi:DNA-directed RNA polymerase subunit RPC12/RpoP